MKKQVRVEGSKSVKDLKMKIEVIKKTQTEGITEVAEQIESNRMGRLKWAGRAVS